jgi:hypothetical protein
MSDALRRLLDKDEIRDLMARYARGVDRGDWDAVRSVYHADAHDDHGDYKGDIDGFIAFARSRTGGATQVMHFLGECLIEFASPEIAVAETYFFTAHTLGPEAQKQYGASASGAPVQLSHYGRYADRVEKRDGAWRIAKRVVIFEATRLALGDVPPLKADWASQRRDGDDPIFTMRSDVGLK